MITEILKAEAFDNFYRKYGHEAVGESDPEEGKRIFEKANATITRQGFVYYTKLTDF